MRLGRACGCLAGTGLVAVGLVIAFGLWALSSCAPQKPPDVAAVSRSERVDAADRQASASLADMASSVWPRQSWAEPSSGSGVEDACGSNRIGMFSSTWLPVSCFRQVVRVATFGGDFAGRAMLLHQRLAELGWRDGTGPDLPRLLAEFHQEVTQRRPLGSPPHPYGPSDFPAAFYKRGPVSLVITWRDRTMPEDDSSPNPASRLYGWAVAATVVREHQALDLRKSVADAARRHRYLAILTLGQKYFDLAETPSPTPTTSAREKCICWSGNLCTCGGG